MLKVKNIKKSLVKLLFNLLDAGKFGFVEIGHIDRAYMIGYNDACEKALEWLREEFDDIFTVTGKWFDINSDEFFDEFQQSLHPRSIEQINNCIKEE